LSRARGQKANARSSGSLDVTNSVADGKRSGATGMASKGKGIKKKLERRPKLDNAVGFGRNSAPDGGRGGEKEGPGGPPKKSSGGNVYLPVTIVASTTKKHRVVRAYSPTHRNFWQQGRGGSKKEAAGPITNRPKNVAVTLFSSNTSHKTEPV